MDNVTKTFRAPDMLSALQQIQQELGSDAIVVSVRKAPGGKAWQVWRNPMVEIIAMKNDNSQQSQTKTKAKAKSDPIAYATKEELTTAAAAKPIAADLEPEIRKSEAIDNLSVSATIKALSQPKKKSKGEWRPFTPPKISLKTHESEAAEQVMVSVMPDEQQVSPQTGVSSPSISIKPETTRTKESVFFPRLLAKYREQLMAQGIEEELYNQIARTCLEILPQSALDDERRVRYLLQRQLEAEIKDIKGEEALQLSPLFIIGNNGSGKTSACAKLAAYAKDNFNKKVAWICADTIRTGAISEAQTYTNLLNIPLHLAYTPEEMERYIHLETEADIIIVDTPDCNPRSEDSVVELGNFVTQVPSRTTFMVLSATTKESDLNQAVAASRPFRIKGLIITNLEETMTYGNVYNLVRKSQIPLAYFTNGPLVFNNLFPATCQVLVDSLFGEGFAK